MGAITKEKKKLSPKALFSSPALVKSAAVLQKIGLFLAVVIMVCYFTFRAPRFILPYNILNIARQMVTLALLSYGLTFVLVGSGVDLSVGSNMSLVSVITALVMVGTGSFPRRSRRAFDGAPLGRSTAISRRFSTSSPLPPPLAPCRWEAASRF